MGYTDKGGIYICDYTKILIKKAKGYIVSDTVEEYAKDERSGGLILKKKKISKKHIPPDVAAIKLLLSFGSGGGDKNAFEDLSDKQLLQMRLDLIQELESMGGQVDGSGD